MANERGPNLNIGVSLDTAQLKAQTRAIINEARALERAFGAISPSAGLGRGQAEFQRAARSIKQVEERVRGATASLSGLAHQTQLTAKRFLIYRVVSGIIFTITKALQDATRTFIAFDLELNKARQILNPLTTDFEQFTKTIFELANAYGVTIAEVQKAQETFIRQGKNAAETNELTRQSLALASAAAFDFAQATEAITSAINQFSGQGVTAVQVADSFTKVANNFAVEAGDIDQALRRAGNAADTVGVSFNNLIGFVTAAQETTRRGGEVIGTALRTIFTRIFRAPSIQLMEELGIATRDASGEFRKADDLLGDLAQKFENLTRTQQISIASTIAGQRQISTFLAVLNNFSRAQEASNTAALSGGEAARIARIRQEALSVQLQKITNQWIEFGNAFTKAFSGPVIEDIKKLSTFLIGIGNVLGAITGDAGVVIDTLKVMAKVFVAQAVATSNSTGRLGNFRKEISQTSQDLKVMENAGRKVSALGKLTAFVGDSTGLRAATATVEAQRQIVLFTKEQSTLTQLVADDKALISQIDTTSIRLSETKLAIDKEAAQITKERVELETNLKRQTELTGQISEKNEKARISTLKERLDRTRALREEELKTAQETLKTLIGSRKAGARAAGRTGGAFTDRDRIETAKQLVTLEAEIAALRERQVALGKVQHQNAETEAKGVRLIANLRQQELERVGQAGKLRATLTKDATEQEKKALAAAEKADIALLNNGERLAKLKLTEAKNTKVVATLEAELVALQTARVTLESILAERKALNARLVDGTITDEKTLETLQKKKLQLLADEAGARATLEVRQKNLNNALRNEAEARANVGKVTTAGQGVRTGLGVFALLSAFNLAEEASKKFFNVTETRAKSLEVVFQGLGGALTTALFVGGLPGAFLAGGQLILTTINLVKNEAFDFKRAIESSQKATDALSQSLSASRANMNSLLEIAKKFSTEVVSVELFKQLQISLSEMDKIFANLNKGELATFKKRMSSIVTSGKPLKEITDELTQIREEADRLNTKRSIEKGQIINTEENTRAIAALLNAKEAVKELQDARDKLLQGESFSVGALGINAGADTELAIDRINKQLVTAKEKLAGLQGEFSGFGDEVTTAFIASIDKTKSFQENIDDLTPRFRTMVLEAGKMDELQDIYNKVVLGITNAKTEGGKFVSVTREQQEVSDRLVDVLVNETGQLELLTYQLGQSALTAGKSATALFTLGKDAREGGTEFAAFTQELAKLDDTDPKNIVQFFKEIREGTRVVKAFIAANGDVSFQVEGMTSLITKEAGPAWAFLNNHVNEFGKFSQVAVNGLDALASATVAAERVNLALAQSYEAMANQVSRSAKALSDVRTALNKVQQSSSEVAQSFPTLALQTSDEAIDGLLASASELSRGLTPVISTFDELERTSDNLNVQLGLTLQQAMLEGGEASDEMRARLQVAMNTMDNMVVTAIELSNSIAQVGDTTQRSPGIDALAKKAQGLAGDLIQLNKLGGAALGLDSLKEELLQSSVDITDSQREAVKGFTDTLGEAFTVDDLDLSGTNEQISARINTLITGLTKNVRSDAIPEAKRAGRLIADALVAGTNTAPGEGGDAIIKSIATLLTQAGTKVTEELKEPIEGLQQAFRGLADESQASLEFIVSSARSNVSQLNQLLSKGINIPDSIITKVLEKDFDRGQKAADIAVTNIGKKLELLGRREAFVKQELVKLGNVEGEGAVTQQQRIALEQQLLEVNEQQTVEEAKKLAIQGEQNASLAQLNQTLVTAIGTFNKGLVEALGAQKAVADAEISLFGRRMSFVDQESQTFAQRARLAQVESQAFEDIRRQITGLPETNISGLGDKLVELTNKKLDTEALDAAAAAGIQGNIDRLNHQLDLEKIIAEGRVAGLEKELQILNEQQKAVRNLALEFLKGNKAQQTQLLKGAQLVDTFFGNIKPQDLKSGNVSSDISAFLRNANDETRSLVIGQLEQLKAVGGEIAPGVGAAELLNQLSDAVAGAIFKDPVIAIAERQEKLQSEIVNAQIRGNQVALVQLRVAEAQLRAEEATLNAVSESVTSREGATQRQVELSGLASSREALSATVNELVAQQTEQIDSSKATIRIGEKQNVSNKELLNTFEGMSITADQSSLSVEDFQNKMVELREALRVAEDGVGDAEQKFSEALGNIGVALVNATKAQAEFNLGIQLAERANIDAVGGFSTFRDEMNFLTDAFNQSITTLQRVGATEVDIAELRKRLAQEQLTIIEQQLGQFKSQAEALLTGGTTPTDIVRQSQSANVAANLANTIANPDDLARAILALGPQFGKDAAEGLKNALPGETFAGGKSGADVLNTILSAVGGTTQEGVSIKTLEEEAAAQRKIIADNSIAGIEQARQQTIAAFGQLQAAQEALLEARAQHELALLQLEATSTGFGETNSIMSTVADGIDNMTRSIDASVAASNALLNQTTFSGSQFSNAAGGTLSGSEARGLLSAAAREKRLMPTGANLGVFNTSETVLTRKQASMLRRSTNVPFAADGFGLSAADTTAMLNILNAISSKLDAVVRDDGVRTIELSVNGERRVRVEGIAGLQTALQDMMSDRTADLFSREEGMAITQFLEALIQKLRVNGLQLPQTSRSV